MGSCALLSRRPWPRGGRAPGQVAGRRPDERLLLVVICWTRQEPGGIGPRRGPGPCRDASQQPGRAGRPAAGAGRRRALPLSVLAPAHGVLSAGCRSSIGRWHSCLSADPERRGSRDRRPDVGSLQRCSARHRAGRLARSPPATCWPTANGGAGTTFLPAKPAWCPRRRSAGRGRSCGWFRPRCRRPLRRPIEGYSGRDPAGRASPLRRREAEESPGQAVPSAAIRSATSWGRVEQSSSEGG
jgi:hypothetical protein